MTTIICSVVGKMLGMFFLGIAQESGEQNVMSRLKQLRTVLGALVNGCCL